MKKHAVTITILLAVALQAQTILFVRGGVGTVGCAEGWGDDQAADITDYSTASKNHGWGEFSDVLREEGYTLEQIKEGDADHTAGAPVPFESMDLSRYAAIVFGSNNAIYPTAAVDAIETYIKAGGSALFVSDKNFGWATGKAANSDQQFLDRFGWTMNCDQGWYTVKRSDGDFLEGNHEILNGVNAFEGEGLSPLTLSDNSIPGVQSTILVRTKQGQDIKRNENDNGGPYTAPTANDASLIIATVGKGRIVGHFDRNTFFNTNGAGSNIFKNEHETLAKNMFAWMIGDAQPVAVTPLRLSAQQNVSHKIGAGRVFNVLGRQIGKASLFGPAQAQVILQPQERSKAHGFLIRN